MTDQPGGRESMRDSFRRYLEQRSPFAGMTRSELEQIVAEFLRGDHRNRDRLEDVIEEVRARSRKSVDRLSDFVRTEARKEFDAFSPSRKEEIGDFFERLVGLVSEYFGPGRHEHSHTREPEAPALAAKQAVKATRQKAAAVKKAAVKKAGATKAAAKKASPKKAPAKRTVAKKSPPRSTQ